ncbi:MAG: tail fiber domain-containing protein [Candidatus Riflebacteria bacterium]|nr:tail fiber domain-containing protein [Candidatus Riflebacteria bacterium]
MITVAFLANPFKPQSRQIKKLSIGSLSEVMPEFRIENHCDFLWVINGEIVDAEDCFRKELCCGDFVAIMPKVGKDSGKNITTLIGMIAVMALTGGTGTGLLTGLLSTKAGTLGLGLALYLGGSLLAGNQKTPKIDNPDYSSSAFEGGYAWNPDQIQITPGNAIPLTYGSIRTSGQLIGRRIATRGIANGETREEQVQFLYLLLAAGEGLLDSITDIKVNDVAISSIENIYCETRLGANNQTAVAGVLTSVTEQQNFSHELPVEISGESWINKTQTEAGKYIELEFVFPSGSYEILPENGAINAVNTFLRAQYRESGTATWYDIFDTGGNPYKQVYVGQRKPYYFSHLFIPPDTSKLYEFRAQNYSLTYYHDNHAWTEIPSNYVMRIDWLSLTACDNVYETYPNTALVAVGIPASENLSGSMPKISWLQTRSKVLVFNPDTGSYDENDATNIAWIIYDLIHQCRRLYNIQTSSYEYVIEGEPASNIDYGSFCLWAAFCGAEVGGVARAKGNLLVDSVDQLWPTIQKIAASARGYIIQQAGVFKPVWDTETSMTQIFTSGNIISGTLKGGFLPERERATAIEASFINEDNGYQKDTIFVEGDDYNPASLDNPTQIFFPGLTKSDIVFKAAKHLLRKNKYLKRTVSFQADIDSIVSQIGDVIGIQSDITSWGAGGRILGATTTQIIIDQNVTMQPGTTYTILVRGSDDALTRRTIDAVISEISTNTLSLTGDPFSIAPERFDLYAFGVSELETKPFQITGIARNGNLQATIDGIEYIEGVYTDDSDFPVINYTTAGAGVNSLTVHADSDTGKLGISWSIPSHLDYTGAIVYIDGKPQGFFRAEITSLEFESTPGSHSVTIFPVDGKGKTGTAVTENIILGNATLVPVSGINLSSVVRQQEDGTSLIFISGYFTVPAMATSVLVEIGEGLSPSEWAVVQDNRVGSILYGPVKSLQIYTLRFTARNKYAVAGSVTENITVAGDTIGPDAPVIIVSSYLKTVTILIGLETVPYDLAGFRIYRNTSNNSATAEIIGSVSSTDGVASYTDEAPEYGETYWYWAKSFDRWGNPSIFSDSDSALILSVSGADIVDGALNRSELFREGVVDADAIATAAVTEAKIAINAVSNTKIAADAVTAAKIAAGAVEEAKIAASAVSATKIASGAVEELKIASNAVTETKIATSAVTNSKIASDAVTELKIASSAVTEAKIATSAVTNTKIAADAVTAAKIAAGAVEEAKLAASAVSATKIATGAVEELKIASNAVTEAKIATSAVTNAKIASDAVTAAKIAAGAVEEAKLAASAVSATKIATGAVEELKIASNAVTETKIATSAVSTTKLAAGAVTAEKLLIGSAGSALNDDPNFEDSSAWTIYTGSIETISDGKVGSKCFRSQTAGYSVVYSAKLTPVNKDKQYRLKAVVRKTANAGVNYRYLQEYNSSGTQIGVVGSGDYTPSSINTWEEKYSVYTPSSTAAFVRVALDTNNSTTGGYTEVQDLRLEEVLPATLIQDGAIITDKLAANAVTAVKIAAGAITSDKLTSSQIVGKDIRTAQDVGSGTSGVKLTSNGLEAWSGTTRTLFLSNSGDADFSGTIITTTGSIAGMSISDYGIGGDVYYGSSLFHTAELRSHPYDSPVNLFDLGGPALRFLSYTNGPYLNSKVTIGAGEYFNGSSTDRAHINIVAESTSRESIYTNGKITGYITNLSDEKIKSDFQSVTVLEKLMTLEVQSWEYDDQKISDKEYEKLVKRCLREKNMFPLPGERNKLKYNEETPHRHIGPTAKQFNELFEVFGGNEESISLGDQIGVALKAIQELAEIVAGQKEEIEALKDQLKGGK